MSNFTIKQEGFTSHTSVPNCFIEQYMPYAAGEFVKIYIYLLKCVGENKQELSISRIADAFNNTEKSKQILINCWNELKEEDNILFNIKERVYNDLITLFERINFRLIVMSQYKSGYYMNQKNYVEELSKTIFNKLKISINTNLKSLEEAMSFDFDDFDVALNEGFSLKNNIQFADNWIAGKYVKE